MEDSIPDILQSTTLSPSSATVVQAGTIPKILGQRTSITSNRFVHNMVEGHPLHLSCHSLLFHNFKEFNIKTAMANHPIIQKELDELLTKDATEPSTGGTGFYSHIFINPRLNLKSVP